MSDSILDERITQKDMQRAAHHASVLFPEKMSQRLGVKVARRRMGRNQACRCGSGKKYKRCCGRPG